MCMVYYLGTDGEAPHIAWNKSKPAFYVSAVEPDVLARVSVKLPHRNLVYIGSRQGCGCGFRRDDDYIEDDIEKNDSAEDHRALALYLAALSSSARAPQVFGCWSGDEGEPIDHRRDFSPSDLLVGTFGFREREILTLKK